MDFEFNLNLIRSNPQYCLAGYRQLDSASTYASFIKDLYEDCCFSQPTKTTLAQKGEYLFACAHGSKLELDGLFLPGNYGGYSGLIEWLFLESHKRPRDRPNSLLSFEGLALIVFLTEWCIVDISTSDEHFRQAFHQGKPISVCERRLSNDLPRDSPIIQLQYVLARPQFHSRIVSLEQIEQTLTYLRDYRLIPKELAMKSSKSMQNGFEIEIAVHS